MISSAVRIAHRKCIGLPLSLAKLSFRFFATKYAKTHEYLTITGDSGVVGITDHAQKALGDIVYVELPEVGRKLKKGESFGSVESVKAASDVYSPVSGVVTAINKVLETNPALVNKSPEKDAWFIKLRISAAAEEASLLNAVDYKALCLSEEKH